MRTSASVALEPMDTPAADTMLISALGLCDHRFDAAMLRSPVTDEVAAR